MMRSPTLVRGDGTDGLIWAAWRCWAADVRDRAGRFAAVSSATAWRAGLLAQALDSWRQQDKRAGRPDSASNLAQPLEAVIEQLIAGILAAGVQPPAELSRIAAR